MPHTAKERRAASERRPASFERWLRGWRADTGERRLGGKRGHASHGSTAGALVWHHQLSSCPAPGAGQVGKQAGRQVAKRGEAARTLITYVPGNSERAEN